MKNKKSIMMFSGILILIFHLWIYVDVNNVIEVFLRQISYVGVDIFFLFSGYSLAMCEIQNYWSFVTGRFKKVYLKYAFFAVVACLYLGWKWQKLLRVLLFIDLFQRGGGAFLWFLPAIMLFYVVYPWFQGCDKKNRAITLVVVAFLWILGAYVGTQFHQVHQLFIIWNRIPVFLLGYYMTSWKVLDDWRYKGSMGVVFSLLGLYLGYQFAFLSQLQIPFTDTFYLVLIPLAFGLTCLISFIPEVKLTTYVGASTLEMYGIQMVFGYKLANRLFQLTGNVWFTNLATISIVVATSALLSLGTVLLSRRIMESCVAKKNNNLK